MELRANTEAYKGEKPSNTRALLLARHAVTVVETGAGGFAKIRPVSQVHEAFDTDVQYAEQSQSLRSRRKTS